MGRTLEKRVKKLEQAVGGLPCDKHNGFSVLVDWPDGTNVSENDARIAEIKACPKCKDSKTLRILHVSWMKKDDPDDPMFAKESQGFTFDVDDSAPVNINLGLATRPAQPETAVGLPDWLKDLEDE